MSISQSAWQETQWNLVQDFLDLFLPPVYEVDVERDYPISSGARLFFQNRMADIELPEKKLLRLEEYWDNRDDDPLERKLLDWPVVLAFELLQGFGHQMVVNLHSAEFEGLKKFADVWGRYLARQFQRSFQSFELFTSSFDLTSDIILAIMQLPAKELGDVIRESATPAYIRAGQIAVYQAALLESNTTKMMETQRIIQAPDIKIQREINEMFGGYSSLKIGKDAQRHLVEFVSAMREVFSSKPFKKYYLEAWPIVARQISWSVGYRLCQNLKYDPKRITRLLEAIRRFGEIGAIMEQYRYKYDWQGDENKAVTLGFRAIARKHLYISEDIREIHKDTDQERLIGVAEGIRDYANSKTAIIALEEGSLGKLAAYLAKAAKNQEFSYHRKQNTEGNKILTKGVKVSDDNEGDELSVDKALRSKKQKIGYRADPVAEEVETKENLTKWYRSLTDNEKSAIELKINMYDNEEQIAKHMGISQQRVSQLLKQALKKFREISY